MIKSTSITIKQVTALVIKSSDDMKSAVSLLSQLNKYMDALVEEKEKVTRPLNEAIKAERARFKPREVELEEMIDKLRSEISRYQTEQIKLAKEAEERILKKLEKGKIDFEQATALVEVASCGVADKIETEEGSIKFRVDKVLKIINAKKVPREYMVVDEKKALEALKEGKEVAGCVLEERRVVVNSR